MNEYSEEVSTISPSSVQYRGSEKVLTARYRAPTKQYGTGFGRYWNSSKGKFIAAVVGLTGITWLAHNFVFAQDAWITAMVVSGYVFLLWFMAFFDADVEADVVIEFPIRMQFINKVATAKVMNDKYGESITELLRGLHEVQCDPNQSESDIKAARQEVRNSLAMLGELASKDILRLQSGGNAPSESWAGVMPANNPLVDIEDESGRESPGLSAVNSALKDVKDSRK